MRGIKILYRSEPSLSTALRLVCSVSVDSTRKAIASASLPLIGTPLKALLTADFTFTNVHGFVKCIKCISSQKKDHKTRC